MNTEELLLLPSKWEECYMWGFYTDVSKRTPLNDLHDIANLGQLEWAYRVG